VPWRTSEPLTACPPRKSPALETDESQAGVDCRIAKTARLPDKFLCILNSKVCRQARSLRRRTNVSQTREL
jgi:hypothetical protein